ncbi:ABC transporter substrate-binding protein [Deinococcus sp. YIM 134068]|uniref:ABC transporter substrate-binding protein n=1 Tax=Deinococcus lichenicola TaxID=3118910 RepID=UPI002F94A90C
MRYVTLLLLTLPCLALAAPNPADWPAVTREARGQTVNFYMWGGSDNINRYVDTVVAPAARRLGVTVRRVPVADTALAVNRVLAEKRAGRTSGGSVDLIWINGENFRTARQAKLLLEGWAERLPNARYVDWQNPSVRNDFGYPVNGAESPWGSTQWQYVYDSARVRAEDLPRSFPALAAWAGRNPGRFTFVAPPDFYGNRFLRMALVELNGGPQAWTGAFDEARWQKASPVLWSYLSGLRPNLWRGGRTFPASIAEQYRLLANGEVDFAFVQNKAGIAAEVESGQLPKTARVYLFDAGTVSDYHYVGIPANARSAAGAMVLANLLLDPELQARKLGGSTWGDGLAINPAKVSAAYAGRVQGALKVGPYTLDPARLNRAAYGDLPAQYDDRIQRGFQNLVK